LQLDSCIAADTGYLRNPGKRLMRKWRKSQADREENAPKAERRWKIENQELLQKVQPLKRAESRDFVEVDNL
jgi:hypothetical protein